MFDYNALCSVYNALYSNHSASIIAYKSYYKAAQLFIRGLLIYMPYNV